MATPSGDDFDDLVNDKMGDSQDLVPSNVPADIEMSDCQSENVREVEDRNIPVAKDNDDVDMGEKESETEQSQNLFEDNSAQLVENNDDGHKEVVETSDGGEGEQEEEPGVEEEHDDQDLADQESQEDEDDVDEGEGAMEKGEDALKDATNTAEASAAEKLFLFPQGTIKRVMKLDPEVCLLPPDLILSNFSPCST